MNTARCTCLLLFFALFAGCAAQKRAVLLPPYQPESPSTTMVAQFGARLSIGGQRAPVQGEVQMTASGGSLALILPHGRTLGICTYSPIQGQSVGLSAGWAAGQQVAQAPHLASRL